MAKFWMVFGWGITLIAQVALSFLLVEVFNLAVVPTAITTDGEFIIIPLTIWSSYLVGVFGIGMLSLIIRKMKPYYTLLRLVGTLVMALIPMAILVFLGLTVGIENQTEFQEIVLDRMVPYYTQLNVVFSLLGFYLPSWFKNMAPKNR